MRVLILGASGMLGYSLFSCLSEYDHLEVFGTVRNLKGRERYFDAYMDNLLNDVNVYRIGRVSEVLTQLEPDVVLNCVGIIKQQDSAKNHIQAVSINSLLPHQLAELCSAQGAKLIHFSTDCVFDGEKGGYREDDLPNATDLYGKSKCLGEVDYSGHLTLRTSIIGHELDSNLSLVDWFLSQKGPVNGFAGAIFSGLPTCYIADVLVKHIFTKKALSGLYHLSVDPISKLDLLRLIAKTYQVDTDIFPSDRMKIDRSLDSGRLRALVGMEPATWDVLAEMMYSDYKKRYGKWRS